MSNTDRDFSFEARQQGSSSNGVAGELTSLLSVLTNQIADADRRQADVLSEMQDRISILTEDTRAVRTQVSADLGPVFTRIEDALSQLGSRMDGLKGDRAQDVRNALATAEGNGGASHGHSVSRSGVPASEPPLFARSSDAPRQAPSSSSIDPFDVVDASRPGGGDDPWNEDDAEALTRILEAEGHQGTVHQAQSTPHAPAPAPVATQALAAPMSDPMSDPMQATLPVEAPLMAPALAFHTPEPHSQLIETSLSDAERGWLENKFLEIAERIDQSLGAMAPAHPLEELDERFGLLEQRFGDALQDVATRSDVEGLRSLESHIADLAAHIDATHVQLSRLDVIEQQIGSVMDQLAVNGQQPVSEPAAAPISTEDIERAALMAAQEVVTRMGASTPAGASDESLGDVRHLIESLISERRQGDEQTFSMLDTLQQALIRVLDRVDAIEVSQSAQQKLLAQERVARPAAAPARESAPASAPVPQAVPAASPFSHVPNEPTHSAPQRETFAPVAEAAPAQKPAAAASEAVAKSGVDKLRQDFIADAVRAKQRAAAAEQQAALAVEIPAGQKPSRATMVPSPDKAEGRKIFGMSPKLIFIALAAVLALNGAMLVFSKKPATPVATPPPAAATQVPAAVPAAPAAPAAQAPAPMPAAPSIPAAKDMPPPPAKPRAGLDDGSPVAGALGGFEFDPDAETSPTPPDSPAATPAAAGGLAGLRLQGMDSTPDAASFARIRQQQNMAKLSGQVGANAAQYMTPAAYLNNEFAVSAAPAQPDATTATGTAPSATQLDLPPATVGPLSLRLAAAKGDPSAQFEVAARLAEGKGTNQNFKEAVRWYQRSAAQSFAQAQYRLGTLYERGLGVKADTGFARDWYQRAAEQGNVKAMHNLAVLSANTVQGSPDYATASKWFAMASERGLHDSQFNLAVLYENGLGVAKDMGAAYKWYSLAARAGDKESARRRDLAKAELSASALTEAESNISSFQPIATETLINDARVAGEDWKKRQSGGDNT